LHLDLNPLVIRQRLKVSPILLNLEKPDSNLDGLAIWKFQIDSFLKQHGNQIVMESLAKSREG